MKGNSGSMSDCAFICLKSGDFTLDDAIKGRHGRGREIYRDE